MRLIRILLIVLDLLAFLVLGVTYFYGFVDSGGITAFLGWGLPVLLASIAALIAGSMLWRRRHWKWGITGLGVSVFVLIYVIVMLFDFSYVMLPGQHDSAQNSQRTTKNEIIFQMVSEDSRYDKYKVVARQTKFPEDVSEVDINSKLTELGYDLPELVADFFKLNQEPSEMTLDSALDRGYYVDHQGVFERYYRDGGIPPLSSYLFRHQVWSYVWVAVPAYDPETGYGLFYRYVVGNNVFQPSGGAEIYLVKYDGQTVEKVEYLMLWVL